MKKGSKKPALPASPDGVSFPFTYSWHSITCKIYRTPRDGYDAFTVMYYRDGERVRKMFGSFAEAAKEVDSVTDKLGTTNADVLELRSADRASYLRARELLDPLGVSLEVAVAQYVHAKALLGATPIAVAVEDYARRCPVRPTDKRVPEIVAEFLNAKRADGCSDRYVKCLKYNLGLFEKRFPGFIQNVAGSDIDVWLRSSGLSPRTRNNVRTSLYTLFKFAEGRRWLPKGHEELNAVAVVKDAGGEIEVFTVAELEEILRHASKRMVAFLALGAFAGIRHAEIQRLDWTDLRFDDDHIEIAAGKAKTASRRLVPLLPNLKEWLKEVKEDDGPVVEHRNVAFEMHMLVKKINQARRSAWATANGVSEDALRLNRQRAIAAAKRRGKLSKLNTQKGEVPPGAETAEMEGWKPFAWKHNGLRHSFISYRLALVKNTGQVALEAGNSPQMIFKHYRELVRPREAEAWFALTPDTVKRTAPTVETTARTVETEEENKVLPFPTALRA